MIKKLMVDKGIYSKDVLLKTAFSFTERAYIHLEQNNEYWVIQWTNKEDEDINPLEFEKELIAQQIRERLLVINSDIRKIVLARAYASSVIELADEKTNGNKIDVIDDGKQSLETMDSEKILKGWFDE